MIPHYLHGSGVLQVQARRAYIDITYKGYNISKDIAADLLSFTYTDNASDNADDIEITLKDEKLKWLTAWFPEKGDMIEATLNTINWNKDGEKRALKCGSFVVDAPEYSGRPRVMSLKGISTPSNSNFTQTKKSRAWENIYFSSIAGDIARSAGLDLFFDSTYNPFYGRQDQSDTSDMSFLSELSKNAGFCFKVTDKTIVIFNAAEYERKPTVEEINETDSKLQGYSFSTSDTNTGYAGCRLKYRNPKNGQFIDYLFTVKELEEDDKVYELNEYASSIDEAKNRAQAKLRELNKKEFTASLSLVGDTRIVAGVNVELVGFGGYSGKYFIDKATHSIPGYNVDIEAHKVLEGY